LHRRGVHAIVAVVHEGAWPNAKTGELKGAGERLAHQLDPDVDVVLEGHSHAKYIKKIDGKIVVQAGEYGEAFAAVDLKIDPRTGDVIDGAAHLVTNDEQGIAPNTRIAKLVSDFQRQVGPKLRSVVSELPGTVSRQANKLGESPLGALVAEAQRQHAHSDIAVFNNGGLRHDLGKGQVTWGQVFAAQPYGNHLMRIMMTGTQIREALEQQFQDGRTVLLQLAGLRATYDLRRRKGERVVNATLADGTPLDDTRTYSVAANDYLAGGGDGFTALRHGKRRDLGVDLAALITYLKAGKPVPLEAPGNISFVQGSDLPRSFE
jgi:5'-nucleotidase